MKDRRFALKEIGSRVKVVSMAPSQHVSKDGTTSNSFMCEVIGIGVLTPGEVLAKMPFMTVDCPDERDCPLNGDRLLDFIRPSQAFNGLYMAFTRR